MNRNVFRWLLFAAMFAALVALPAWGAAAQEGDPTIILQTERPGAAADPSSPPKEPPPDGWLPADLVSLEEWSVPVPETASDAARSGPPPAVMLSDGQYVYGPNVGDFDARDYIAAGAPHLGAYANAIYERAHLYSINPRVLLALMELRSGLVSNPAADLENPFGLADPGFIAQLDGVGAALNEAFYARLYGGAAAASPRSAAVAQWNAGSSALYDWLAGAGLGDEALARAAAAGDPASFVAVYTRLFPGDDPLSQDNRLGDYADGPSGPLTIPATPPALLQLPYARGQAWSYNFVHAAAGGSDMSSLDFARSPRPWPNWASFDTSGWTVAAAAGGSGLRVSNCNYKITHEGGWMTAYYHLKETRASGSVSRNETIGKPETVRALALCNGGAWDAIHVHFTLLYNGAHAPLNGRRLSGWRVHSGNYPGDGDPSRMYFSRPGDGNKTRGELVNNDYDSDDGRALAPGYTYNGNLSPASDADIYTFTGVQGRAATIDLTRNGNVDPYLYLIRPDGVITSNDDWNGTLNSHIHIPSLPQSGQYIVMARSYANRSSGYYQVRLSSSGATSCPDGQFRAEYWNNRSMSGSPVYTRCEGAPIPHNWGGGGPGNGVTNDNFSARWTGRFNFSGGNTRFIARADDGVRVYVDGERIIDQWKDQGPTEYAAVKSLGAGMHEVRMEYYENGGGAVAQLRWESAATTSCAGQYKAEYWSNAGLSGSPARTVCESWPIVHNWGGGAPSGIPADNFSGRWTTRVPISAGNYTFIARADDGVRVWLDGALIINEWRDQAPATFSRTLYVNGGDHDIRVDYYERGGGATLQFRWEAAGSSGGNCTPNADQVALFVDGNYQGACVVRGAGSYANPAAIGLPNDSISSVKVGSNMRLTLYQHDNYGGSSSQFNGNDGNLSDNNIGNDSVSSMRVERRSSSGGGGNLALNRPAAAWSLQSASYSPGRGNDGNNGTRWSSTISTSLGEQRWWVDLGSSREFNRVRVNWENAYAARYRLLFSHDGRSWYCYCNIYYTRGGAGWADHTFTTVRFRYMAIQMLNRAPRMNNYSFWEAEVHHNSGRAADGIEDELQMMGEEGSREGGRD